MSFNRFTYYANAYAREAADYLRQAREAKAQGRSDRVPNLVVMARSSARLSRINRELRQLQLQRRAI